MAGPVVFEIRNTGNGADLIINSPILTGAESLHFSLDKTGTSSIIAPGDSTFFSVTFKPQEAGTFKNKSSVVIDSNDPHRVNNFAIRLYGEGL
jgi:hypothetical protein